MPLWEAARERYLRAGFKVTGLLPRAMKDGDRYIDEELMMRSLQSGTPPREGPRGVTTAYHPRNAAETGAR